MLNSNESVRLDEKLKINVQIADVPAGGCSHVSEVPDMILRKLRSMRSVIRVGGNDNMCLAKCMVLADALITFGATDSRYREILKSPKKQANLARVLLTRLGLSHSTELGIDDVKAFEEVCLIRGNQSVVNRSVP